METPLLSINGVHKQYSLSTRKSLSDVSFQVIKGEKFGIFGPNGAGKTTLISSICGLSKPNEGSIEFHFNKRILTPKQALPFIGYVPQDFAFFFEMTPLQNLHYFGALLGIDKKTLEFRSHELLEILGLTFVANDKTETFSGGMKRRVNLAIGILNHPELLVLDEPTVGVDVQSKVAIMDYLELLNSKGMTIFYTSHHLSEAEQFCDRISLIDEGKLVAVGTMHELLATSDCSDLESYFIQLTGKGYRDQ